MDSILDNIVNISSLEFKKYVKLFSVSDTVVVLLHFIHILQNQFQGTLFIFSVKTISQKKFFTVVLDTVDCIDITFAFDTADTTTERSISIKAIQYICGDDNGGPPGCLQYFQENTGTVAR